jgi:hypothetical protein
MRKDSSNVSEYAKHTRKRTGLRRRVNKAERANVKRRIEVASKDLAVAGLVKFSQIKW